MPETAEYANDDDDVLEERSKLEKIEILPPTEKEYSGISIFLLLNPVYQL